jgi:hypothetical protein
MYDLHVAPAGVIEAKWMGLNAAHPRIGELWLISWNGEALALALISGVAPSFVLVWPVTLSSDPVFAPAVEIQNSPLGTPVLAWPTRETGVGMHLLHRLMGDLLSETTMAQINAGIDGEGELPIELAAPTADGETAEQASDRMIDLWEQINLNVWPVAVPGAAPFNQTALQQLSLSVTDLQEMLRTSLPTAASLFGGQLIPTAEQVAAVAEALGTSENVLLASSADEGTLLMVEPEFKAPILQAAETRSMSELEVRDRTRSEFALAARSDGSARSRLHAAIERVIAGT